MKEQFIVGDDIIIQSGDSAKSKDLEQDKHLEKEMAEIKDEES